MTESVFSDIEMMKLLECVVGSTQYFIDCSTIDEVLRLPLLTTAEGGHSIQAGLLNLRGEVLEVIDARRILGYPADAYELSDRVIVIKCSGVRFGLLVQNTSHVVEISHHQIQTARSVSEQEESGLADSVVCTTDGLHPVLDVSMLLEMAARNPTAGAEPRSFDGCINREDRDEFQMRAAALMDKGGEFGGTRHAYAVVKIRGEHYGFALETITEFLKVDVITPVPCCPPHILGNANWRGDLLTVIDVSGELDLSGAMEQERSKVVVFGEKRDAVGVLVDEVYDICQLPDKEIMLPPKTLKATADGYLTGVAEYNGHTFGIICVETLLMRDRWRVNEVV